MAVIKWYLSFVTCNFGLKSYLWFQIEHLAVHSSDSKSRVWFQTKVHSTKFDYHYLIYRMNFLETEKANSCQQIMLLVVEGQRIIINPRAQRLV